MAKGTALDLSKVPQASTQPLLPGFYDPSYEAGEIRDLNNNLYGDLISEIALVRVIMRRALNRANGIEDLGEQLRVLNGLGLTAVRLARLLEVQRKLNVGSSSTMDALTQALLEVNERLESE